MKKTEKIDRIKSMVKKAHRLQMDEDYFNAYGVWDDVVTELNTLLESVAATSKFIKAFSAVTVVATIGPDPIDLIIIPLLNKGLFKLFNVDTDFITGRMNQALRMRQICLYHEPKLIEVSSYLEELSYYTFSYKVANEVQNSTDKIKNLLRIINPLQKVESLKFVKNENELIEEIYDILINGRISDDMRIIGKSLKRFLEGKKKTNNLVYEALKR